MPEHNERFEKVTIRLPLLPPSSRSREHFGDAVKSVDLKPLDGALARLREWRPNCFKVILGVAPGHERFTYEQVECLFVRLFHWHQTMEQGIKFDLEYEEDPEWSKEMEDPRSVLHYLDRIPRQGLDM